MSRKPVNQRTGLGNTVLLVPPNFQKNQRFSEKRVVLSVEIPFFENLDDLSKGLALTREAHVVEFPLLRRPLYTLAIHQNSF